MKHLLTFTILLCLGITATSCHKYKHYSCICSNKDTMFVERIGRQERNTAYGSCKVYQDQYNVSCIVEIRK